MNNNHNYILAEHQDLGYVATEFYKGVLLAKIMSLNLEGESFIHRDYKKVIAAPIRELNLTGHSTSSKSEIITIYNSIIDHTSNKLMEILESLDQDQLILSLYTAASYMTKIHYYMELTGNGALTPEKIAESDYFDQDEKTILFYVAANHDKFSHTFQSFKGFDKAIVQTLVYYYQLTKGKGKRKADKPLEIHSLFDLYELAASLIISISDREFVTSGFYKNALIQITADDIQFVQDLERNKTEILMKNMSGYYSQEHASADDTVIKALEPEFTHVYGFKINTVEKVFMEKFSSAVFVRKRAYAFIIEHKKLIELLRKEGYCSKSEAESVIKYFRLKDLSIDHKYNSGEKLESRLFEHPIIDYKKDHYLISYYLFHCAIDILRHKLAYGLLEGCNTKNPKIIKKKIKDQFEISVKEQIAPYMDKTELNFQDFDYIDGNKTKRIHLKYEMDVIAVKGRKLYIFECKDIYFKFSSSGIRSDINKTIGFINGFKNKINQIQLNKQYLTQFLECEFTEIVSVLVFKYPNPTQNADVDTTGVHILSYSELQEWLKGQE